MAFTLPDFSAIKTSILRDVANLAQDARLQDDSDWLIRAAATASAIEGIYQHQAWIVRQIFPDTADSDMLELHAAVRGLARKSATAASGIATATGTTGTVIAAGQILKAPDGRSYQTSAESTLDATGQANVAVSAVDAGESGNLSSGTTLTWQSPPLGVDSSAQVDSIVGGVDTESDASLLARLLDLIRRPPAGGNAHDYWRWALEVDGVTAAYVYPLRRGLGTVDVVITSGFGLPSDETLATTRKYIEEVRPVTARNCAVLAPQLRLVPVSASVALAPGYVLAQLQTDIASAVETFFNQIEPGQPLVCSKLAALITDLPGVTDCQLLAPVGNVSASVDAQKVEWLRQGSLQVSQL